MIAALGQTFSLSLFVDTETDRIVNLACNTAMDGAEGRRSGLENPAGTDVF